MSINVSHEIKQLQKIRSHNFCKEESVNLAYESSICERGSKWCNDSNDLLQHEKRKKKRKFISRLLVPQIIIFHAITHHSGIRPAEESNLQVKTSLLAVFGLVRFEACKKFREFWKDDIEKGNTKSRKGHRPIVQNAY